jgi:CubicO group peptidase (beta-lactamase class C family)
MTAGLAWHEFDTPYAEATNSATLMRCAFDPNRYVLELQTVARPGEIWNYNSGTSGLIGTILARATGKPVEELARTLLFEPLGIDDVGWTPRLRNGYGMLRLRPRDWTAVFERGSRLFQLPGWLNRRRSRSRRTIGFHTAISGGSVDR